MFSLNLAALDGNLEKVRTLIHEGADVNMKSENGFTSLHYCARFGYTGILKILVSHGADVNAKLKSGWTSLHISADNGHVDSLKALISFGAEVNTKQKDGWTALHLSARSGHVDVAKALISNGAVVDAKNNNGMTPLYISGDYGKIDVLKALISAGAVVNATAMNGYTPLRCSVINGYANIVKELIIAGADDSIENKRGRTFCDLLTSSSDIMKETVIKCTLLYQFKPSLKIELERRSDEFPQVWCKCEKQVERMKDTLLGVSRTSFYEFITEICENKLAFYTSEENFGLRNDLERYIETFSMYEADINEQFKKGSQRANLLHKSLEFMRLCFSPTLPPELIKKICEYLANADLQNFLNVPNIV